MDARDPRRDPRPGDHLRMETGWTRRVQCVFGGVVVYATRDLHGAQFVGGSRETLASWVLSCATATVVTVAGEEG